MCLSSLVVILTSNIIGNRIFLRELHYSNMLPASASVWVGMPYPTCIHVLDCPVLPFYKIVPHYSVGSSIYEVIKIGLIWKLSGFPDVWAPQLLQFHQKESKWGYPRINMCYLCWVMLGCFQSRRSHEDNGIWRLRFYDCCLSVSRWANSVGDTNKKQSLIVYRNRFWNCTSWGGPVFHSGHIWVSLVDQ